MRYKPTKKLLLAVTIAMAALSAPQVHAQSFIERVSGGCFTAPLPALPASVPRQTLALLGQPLELAFWYADCNAPTTAAPVYPYLQGLLVYVDPKGGSFSSGLILGLPSTGVAQVGTTIDRVAFAGPTANVVDIRAISTLFVYKANGQFLNPNLESRFYLQNNLFFTIPPAPKPILPTGDEDGDGIPNGLETLLGTNPRVKDNDLFAATDRGLQLFVQQTYRDFLAREADAGGLQFWLDELKSGRQQRTALVENFLNSDEFQGKVAPIARLYFAIYGRLPDPEGFAYWRAEYAAGRQSLEQIATAFATAPEFVAQFGQLDNRAYVKKIYLTVLGREADLGGENFWTAQLDSGAPRGKLLAQFSEGGEYRAAAQGKVTVFSAYQGLLKRVADAGGFAYWVAEYARQGNAQALINGFLGSPEYRARFLP